MSKTKYFIGEARMSAAQGVNEYQLRRDGRGKLVFVLRGTFTLGELKAFTDALAMENEAFEMPGSYQSIN